MRARSREGGGIPRAASHSIIHKLQSIKTPFPPKNPKSIQTPIPGKAGSRALCPTPRGQSSQSSSHIPAILTTTPCPSLFSILQAFSSAKLRNGVEKPSQNFASAVPGWDLRIWRISDPPTGTTPASRAPCTEIHENPSFSPLNTRKELNPCVYSQSRHPALPLGMEGERKIAPRSPGQVINTRHRTRWKSPTFREFPMRAGIFLKTDVETPKCCMKSGPVCSGTALEGPS